MTWGRRQGGDRGCFSPKASRSLHRIIYKPCLRMLHVTSRIRRRTSHLAEQLLFYPQYHRHLPRFCSPTWQALGEWSIYLERHTLFTVPILRFKVAQSFTTIVLHIHVNKWRSSCNFGLVNHWSGLREVKMYTNINPETEVDCFVIFFQLFLQGLTTF